MICQPSIESLASMCAFLRRPLLCSEHAARGMPIWQEGHLRPQRRRNQAAMPCRRGSTFVFHTASPVLVTSENPQEEVNSFPADCADCRSTCGWERRLRV